jgi:non-ribosomal peptide synthetase component F
LHPERQLGRSPLFNVMFAHQTIALNPGASSATLDEKGEAAGAPAWTIEDGSAGWAKFDLWLSVIERPSCLRASLEYAAELFDRSTAASFLEDFAHAIVRMTSRADDLVLTF